MPAEPFPRTARYTTTVVWSTGTTIDTSALDDVTPFLLNRPGHAIDGIGRDQIRAYAPPAAPAYDFVLNNWGREFSPGGEIGALVGRGSDTHLDVAWGTDYGADDAGVDAGDPNAMANGVEPVRLFDGKTNSVEHTLTKPSRSVQIRALGHLATLLDRKPRSGELHENIATDVAVGLLLDAVGWPADKREIGSGSTQLLYWWMDGETAGLDVLTALLGAEGAGGCAYEQAGVFHFEGRETRQVNPRSLETQWIFSDGFAPDGGANAANVGANDARTLANGQTDVLLYDVNASETESNPDEVVASVTAQINQRVAVPTQTGGDPPEVGKIWEYGAPFDLATGETLVTETLLSDPYRDAVAPVMAPEGGGPGPYDYALQPPSGAVAVALLQASGIRVRIRWTNTGPPVTVRGDTSNGPQLRAVSLPVAAPVVVRSTIDTSATAPRYAAREMQWAMWPEVARGQATATVNSMCRRYQSERRQATIRVANLDSRHMTAIMHTRVSDRVTWVQAHGGINDPYWVEQIGHEISPGGGLHIMTLGLERVFDVTGGRFDATGPSNGFDISVFGD